MKDNNLAIRIRIKDDNFTPTQLPENDAQQELLWFRDLLVLGLVIILVAGGWWAWQYRNDENSGNKQIASNAEVPVTTAAAPVATPKPDTTPETQSTLQSAQVNPVEPDTSTNVSAAAPETPVVADDNTAIAAPVNTHAAMSSDVTSSVTSSIASAVSSSATNVPLNEAVTAAIQVPVSKPDAALEVAEALISEEPQSLPVPPKVQLSDSPALAEVTLITPNIGAASLSLEMIDYEPGQALPQTVYLEDKALVTVYFFATYQGLQGQSIAHRWLHNGKHVATIQSRIEQARSGAHSSKRINRVMYGAWEVQVLSENGELLATGRFDVAPPES